MRVIPRYALVLALFPIVVASTAGSQAVASASPSRSVLPAKQAAIAQDYGKLPLSFEANQGQADPQVRFLAHGRGYSLLLTGDKAVLVLHKPQKADAPAQANAHAVKADVIRMQLVGANPSPQIAGEQKLPGTANYFIGSDPSKWHSDVSTYAKVRYSNVYPGVDLVYYGNQGQLEYDFVVAPGADPESIRLSFAGAKKIKLGHDGNLRLLAGAGETQLRSPVIYQTMAGKRKPVDGHFRLLADGTTSFLLGEYDHSLPLVIDPVWVYVTYLGSTEGSQANSEINAIAVDASGNAYVTGYTDVSDFVTTPGAYLGYDPDPNNVSFVTKINPAGTALVYSTFLGGTGNTYGNGEGDLAESLAINSTGEVYVTGLTYSSDFPVTTGAFQTTNKAAGNSGLPAGFGATGFVTHLSADGSSLIYSTYLGGSSRDLPSSLALDTSNDAYIAGITFSADFPTTSGAFQTKNNSASNKNGWNAFVAKLNPSGSALEYSTYLGGSGENEISGGLGSICACALAVDGSGDAYIGLGNVQSTDFPVTSGVYQSSYPQNGAYPGVATLTELKPDGSGLVYSTYLFNASLGALALDSSGNVYIGGTTATGFPATTGAFQTAPAGDESEPAYVAKVNSTGTALVFATLLGGTTRDMDSVLGIALDSSGNSYLVGWTQSPNFPTTPDALVLTGAATSWSPFFTILNSDGSSLKFSTFLAGGGGFLGTDYGSGVALGTNGLVYIAGNGGLLGGGTLSPIGFMPECLDFGCPYVLEINLNEPTPAQTPTFSLASGTYASSVTVSIRDTTPNATIYYTTDGSTPTTSSTVYTGDLTINGTETVQAIATAPGFGTSAVASATYTITAATPTFSPAAGTYTSVQTVTISDATSGATIYYTTDGSTPTTSSTEYTGPITVSSSETISAIAVASGVLNSSVATATYTINLPAAATPAFSLAGGTYASTQTVTVSDATSGATIYYTTDGSTPTTSSAQYTGAITVASTETIEAIAVASGYSNSAVASTTYTINNPTVTATPAFDPVEGEYDSLISVTITDTTPEATIYYTTDGSTPTTSSAVYTSAIAVTPPEILEAIATAKGYGNSAVAIAKYTVKEPLAATPTFKPAPGVYPTAQSVTISDSTPGAAIYYTTDGTQPTTASTPYESPIPVGQSTTIKAFATAPDYVDSSLGTAAYVIEMPYYNLPPGGSATGGAIDQFGNTNPVVGSGLSYPSGVSIDGQGNLYFGNVTFNPVRIDLMERTTAGAVTDLGNVLDTSGGTIQILPSEFSVAADLAGNVYYMTPTWNSSNGTVPGALYKFGTKAPLVNNLSYPAGIATDYAGDVYFANLITSPFHVELMEYTTDGEVNDLGTIFQTSSAVEIGGWAFDLAVDPSGNVYYNVPSTATGSAQPNGAIMQFVGIGATPISIAPDLDHPTGLSTDVYGDIFFNDFNYAKGTVELEELPSGGTVQQLGQTYQGGFQLGPWAFDVVAFRPPTATPGFSPVPGNYTKIQSVTLSDSTPGAQIYYNINGANPPTTSSTLYTGPIAVLQSETISAIAVSTGYVPSSVANGTYNIYPQAETPVISPAGGTYTSVQAVTISDATSGATIYYTTDGSTPKTSSTEYTGPITVGSSETINAIAAATGDSNSAVASATFTINLPIAATPTFSPAAGTYTSAQTVTISDTTSGATIYYTTDGSTPTASSTKYSGPITVSSTETVSAIATASGYTASAAAIASYTINLPPEPVVTLSPTSLTFAAQNTGSTSTAQTVTLTNGGAAALSIASIATSGDFAETNTCGSSVAAAASCAISVTFTPTAGGTRTGSLTITDNASGSPQTVSLSGTGSTVTESSSPNSLTISSAGGSATDTIQLSSAGGFSGTVNLSCSVAYKGSGTASDAPTCTLNPTQAQISSGSSSSTTLTVSTTASSSARLNNPFLPLGGGALAAVLIFVGVPRRRWRGLSLVVILGMAIAGMCIGCGGSGGSSGNNPPANPGTTTGNYSVTVTATSGTMTASVSIPLTVQ